MSYLHTLLTEKLSPERKAQIGAIARVLVPSVLGTAVAGLAARDFVRDLHHHVPDLGQGYYDPHTQNFHAGPMPDRLKYPHISPVSAGATVAGASYIGHRAGQSAGRHWANRYLRKTFTKLHPGTEPPQIPHM